MTKHQHCLRGGDGSSPVGRQPLFVGTSRPHPEKGRASWILKFEPFLNFEVWILNFNVLSSPRF
jgi:hypothetical protein